VVTRRSLQVLLGGSWHDFHKFAEYVQHWVACESWDPHVSFDPGCLLRLVPERPHAVLINTCYDAKTNLNFDAAEVNALKAWVHAGGGLLAIHATAVAAEQSATLSALIGGHFIGHPPKQRFLVKPASKPHPITTGIAEFETDDEPYELHSNSDVTMHLSTTMGACEWPLAWSRQEGSGRVVYLSLGHDEAAWRLESYRSLVLSALSWLGRS
jgi:type 1 glutamine amidotransferase